MNRDRLNVILEDNRATKPFGGATRGELNQLFITF